MKRGHVPLLLLLAVLAACGKRGAPLPPLRVAAEPITELRALQRGGRILLDAPVPARYDDGSPFVLGRIEVLLRAGEAAAAAPPDAVPPVAQEAPFAAAIADRATATPRARPNPARLPPEPLRFAREALRVRSLSQPEELREAVVGGRIRLEIEAPADAAGRAAVALELFGQRAQDRGRLSPVTLVRIGPTPAAPPGLTVENVDGGVLVSVGASPGSPLLLFRRVGERGVFPGEPVGGKLVTAEFLDVAVALGTTACYASATVLDTDGDRAISALSPEACVKRLDRFAPDPPTGLQAFASGAGVLLSWRPASAPDVAGYRVYRRVDGGERVLQNDGEPVSETSYLDAGPPPGRQVSYQVSAVDGAEPANESAATAWVAADAAVPRYR